MPLIPALGGRGRGRQISMSSLTAWSTYQDPCQSQIHCKLCLKTKRKPEVFIAELLKNPKSGVNSNVHPTYEWNNKIQYIHVLEYYSVIKRNQEGWKDGSVIKTLAVQA